MIKNVPMALLTDESIIAIQYKSSWSTQSSAGVEASILSTTLAWKRESYTERELRRGESPRTLNPKRYTPGPKPDVVLLQE